MYDQMKPFVQRKILEIESGKGNTSSFLIKDYENVVLSDIRKNYVKNYNSNIVGLRSFKWTWSIPIDEKHKKL